MLELKHKQHAENFNNINALQMEGGLITKNYGPKIYRLLKLVSQRVYQQTKKSYTRL